MTVIDVSQYERWETVADTLMSDLQLAATVLGPDAVEASVNQIQKAEPLND